MTGKLFNIPQESVHVLNAGLRAPKFRSCTWGNARVASLTTVAPHGVAAALTAGFYTDQHGTTADAGGSSRRAAAEHAPPAVETASGGRAYACCHAAGSPHG